MNYTKTYTATNGIKTTVTYDETRTPIKIYEEYNGNLPNDYMSMSEIYKKAAISGKVDLMCKIIEISQEVPFIRLYDKALGEFSLLMDRSVRYLANRYMEKFDPYKGELPTPPSEMKLKIDFRGGRMILDDSTFVQ